MLVPEQAEIMAHVGPNVGTPVGDGSWLVAALIFTATLLLAAFAASMLIETVKKSLLLGEWTRRKRHPEDYGKAIFKWYVLATLLSTTLSTVLGFVLYDPALLGVAGACGGLGSRVLYKQIIEKVIRGAGDRASKRIAGHTVAPKPRNEETFVGTPAVTDETDDA